MTCKWLITMVIVSHPKDRVILFQMAELHGMYLNGAQAIIDNASPNDATTCPLTHP